MKGIHSSTSRIKKKLIDKKNLSKKLKKKKLMIYNSAANE